MTKPHLWLRDQYLRRRDKNSAYSLRAFARFVGISSGRLSQLMAEKRAFTEAHGEQLAAALELSKAERDRLFAMIGAQRTKEAERRVTRQRRREAATPLLEAPALDLHVLSEKQVEMVCDPIHYAILSLFDTEDFKPSHTWVARRLKVPAVTAAAALDRLEFLGLIHRNGERWSLVHGGGVKSGTDIPSAAIRKHQKGVMVEAAATLDEVAVDLRDVTSITMAIDPVHLPEAKRLIADFRRSLAGLLESGAKREVYRLAVQLFPVSEVRR